MADMGLIWARYGPTWPDMKAQHGPDMGMDGPGMVPGWIGDSTGDGLRDGLGRRFLS